MTELPDPLAESIEKEPVLVLPPDSLEVGQEILITTTGTWNQWAPDALSSPLAPAHLVEAYNRWQPDRYHG